MATIDIWGVPFSNYVWSVRIACAEKGIDCELHRAFPQSVELSAHPQGKMPVIRHGETILFETKAILTYIDRVFEGPALMLADPLGAAQVEQWCSYVNTSVDPVVMRAYVVPLAFGKPDEAQVATAAERVRQQFEILDRALTQTGFLAGAQFTMADILLLPMIASAQRYPEAARAIESCPALADYHARLAARPSIASTAPPFRR